MELTFRAEKDYTRVDLFLRSQGVTGTQIKRSKYGNITRDGVALRTTDVVKAGDVIVIGEPETANENIPPIDIPLNILYEDDAILVVNKPRNMPVHPSRGNHLPTLANAVVAYCGDRPFTFRAVNRLDRGTSGIVLIAKSPYAASRLSVQMQQGDFEKEYIAYLSGIPDPPCGTVDAPIAREAEGCLRRVVREDGQRAVTDYEVIAEKPEGCLCRLRLHTGRTHQIRVHMAHIGCPLLGDFLYGTEREGEPYYLHATRLAFTHPLTDERIEIHSLPDFI